MNPRVKKVSANPDFSLHLVFENGEEKLFDMKPFLKIGVFKELKNYKLFSTVKPFLGTVAWKNGQDLGPDTLYIDGKTIQRKSNKKRNAVLQSI